MWIDIAYAAGPQVMRGVGDLFNSTFLFLLLIVISTFLFLVTFQKPKMNRVGAYFLIPIGAQLGYIASYFLQRGAMRMYSSLGDYVSRASDILYRTSEELPESVSETAWIGIILGAVLMAILAFIISSSRSTPSSK